MLQIPNSTAFTRAKVQLDGLVALPSFVSRTFDIVCVIVIV